MEQKNPTKKIEKTEEERLLEELQMVRESTRQAREDIRQAMEALAKLGISSTESGGNIPDKPIVKVKPEERVRQEQERQEQAARERAKQAAENYARRQREEREEAERQRREKKRGAPMSPPPVRRQGFIKRNIRKIALATGFLVGGTGVYVGEKTNWFGLNDKKVSAPQKAGEEKNQKEKTSVPPSEEKVSTPTPPETSEEKPPEITNETPSVPVPEPVPAPEPNPGSNTPEAVRIRKEIIERMEKNDSAAMSGAPAQPRNFSLGNRTINTVSSAYGTNVSHGAISEAYGSNTWLSTNGEMGNEQFSPEKIREQIEHILQEHPEFKIGNNPFHLPPPALILINTVYEKNIANVFQHHDQGLEAWKEMKDMKADELLKSKNPNPLTNHLTKLHNITKLKPGRNETVCEYMARALQKAAQLGKLDQAKFE